MSTSKRPASRRALVRIKARPKARRPALSSEKMTKAAGARATSSAMPAATVKATVAKVLPARTAAAPRSAGRAARERATAGVCRLTGSLVIRDARASLAQLCAALESGCTCVDVSGVDTIDTSGVQLLLAAAMEWRRREQPLTLTGYEHLVFGAAEQLGLQSLLPITAGVEP
ncbi:MAG: STAS domain-containing protein [Steroidobacteraceae bacterium]|jgi:anti-anti-sigma regulatory factor